jgi:hypothetical protein
MTQSALVQRFLEVTLRISARHFREVAHHAALQ